MPAVNQVVPQGAGASAGGLATEHPAARGRVIILNALPLNAFRGPVRLDVLPVGINDLATWIQRRLQEGYEVVHYVRHPATITVLRSLGIPLSEQPNAGLYTYQPNDVVVVVTLRAPQRGQEQAQVSVSDLEAWVVTVL